MSFPSKRFLLLLLLPTTLFLIFFPFHVCCWVPSLRHVMMLHGTSLFVLKTIPGHVDKAAFSIQYLSFFILESHFSL